MNTAHLTVVALITLTSCGIAAAQKHPDHDKRPDKQMFKRWAEADLDKDGLLSKAEAQVAGWHMVVDNFEALDTHKDGKISTDELRTFGKARRADRNAPSPHPSATPAQSPAAALGQRPPLPHFRSPDERRQAMKERFNKADINDDGGLSRAEVQASGNTRLLEHFEAMDTNKDGKITPEEIRALWQRRETHSPAR